MTITKSFLAASVASLLSLSQAQADNYSWTNTGALGNFTNAANWGPAYSAVPGDADNANFTTSGAPTINWSSSVTNSSALFNTTNNTVTLAIGAANTWLLTNSFIVGQNAGKTATVVQSSGNLIVANDAGTAALIVGQGGRGAFTLNSGSTVFANQLLATNNTIAGQTNWSVLNLNGGTLITSNAANQLASRIITPSTGTVALSVAGIWTLAGGSNQLTASALGIGNSVLSTSATGVITVANGAVLTLGSAPIALGSGLANNGSSLSILNGGIVSSGNGQWGSPSGGEGFNQVLVSGSGSVWNLAAFNIYGHDNSTIVSNGGKVLSSGAIMQGNSSSRGDNHRILVTGAGSYLSATSVELGRNGGSSSNSITVANGGALSSSTVAINLSSNSSILVTDSGSVWSNSSVSLGSGSSHSLIISNSGAMVSQGYITIGNSAISTNNNLLIANTGRLASVGGTLGWNGASSNSVTLTNSVTWSLGNGLLTWGAGLATNNTLTVDSTSWITNAGGLSLNDAGRTVYLTNQTMNGMNIAFSGGALNIGTGPYLAPPSLVMSNFTLNPTGGSSSASTIGNGCANITASIFSGSLWNGGNQALTVGSAASSTNNNLLIDGGTVSNMATVSVVGRNRLTVTRGGALYSTDLLSANGKNSSLVVSQGGRIVSSYNSTGSSLIGLNATDTNASWLITDPGSVVILHISKTSYLNMGNGFGNWLTISNGAAMYLGGYFTFGSASNQAVTVTGSNSVMSIGGTSGTLIIGSNNTFTVADGGVVNSGSTMVGNNTGSYNDLLLVTGRGSVLTNSGLNIGYSTGALGNHRVIVSDGGTMVSRSSDIVLGYAGGHSNSLLVTGNGSVVSNTVGAVLLGYNGAAFYSSFNTVTVSNGGKLFSGSGAIGNYSYTGTGSCFNVGTVTDPGSLWQMNGGLALGLSKGNGNRLVVSNGGSVRVGAVTVGNASASMSNSITLTATGTLYSSGAVNIGANATANSNTVLVNGTGTLWDASLQALTVGATTSSNNSLTINQGGAVDNIGTLTIAGALNSVNLLGGTLGVKTTTYTNGLFTVGDGVQVATLKSLAGGMLSFNSGLVIPANATLAGVGTASGAGTGVTLQNNSTVSPGLAGAGTLTVGGSNLTWSAGGVYDCAITNMDLGFGVGWSVLNVSSQLVFSGTTPNFVIKLDSNSAVPAGFDTARNYTLKIVSYGSMTGYNTNLITLDDTSAFQPTGLAWSLLNTNNALWLVYKGTAPDGDANAVWAVPSNGNWSVAANWTGNAVPASSPTNVLTFGDNGTPYNSSNNLSGAFQLNKLALVNISGVTNIIQGNALSFESNGAVAPRLEYQSGGGLFMMSNALSLTAGTVFGGAGGGTLVLASNVTGGQPLVKEGPWTLALRGSNTFANPVVVSNAGVIRVVNNKALSQNSIVVTNGGVLEVYVAYTNGDLGVLRSARVTGSGSLWSNSAALTIGSNATLTVDNGGKLLVRGGSDLTLNNSAGVAEAAVLVANGGRLIYSNSFAFGGSSPSNTVKITGAGSRMEGNSDQSSGTSYLTIGNGATRDNTCIIDDFAVVTNTRFTVVGPNSLIISNNGYAYSASIATSGGTSNGLILVLGGNNVTSILAGILSLPGINARAIIDGGGVDGSALGTFSFSLSGSGNSLIVTNKGRYVSASEGSNISGAGNSLQVLDGCYMKIPVGPNSAGTGVGNGTGSNNYVLVENAGSVLELSGVSTRRFEIGYYTGSMPTMNTGNRLLVRNNGMLTNASMLGVGCFVNVGDRSTNCMNNGIVVSSTGLVYSSGALQIGFNGGVTGNFAKVTDAGSYWSMGNQLVTIGNTNGLGQSTNNYLLITDGGIMENVGALQVYSNNQAFLNGGTLGLVNAGVSNGLPFLAGDGTQAATLKAQGGTLSFPAGLVITNLASLTGSGIIAATSTVYGTLSPGVSVIGTITNRGDLTLKSGATTKIDLNAYTTPGAGWDLLTVTNGTLTLNGTLNVLLTSGFAPTNTQSFAIMTNQTASSTIANPSAFGSQVAARATEDGKVVGFFTVAVSSQSVVLNGYTAQKAVPGTVIFIR